VRDPKVNECIMLPVAERATLIEGMSRADLLRDAFHRRGLQGYIFQTGQPPEVHQAFLAAMGINEREIAGPEVQFDALSPYQRSG